MEIALRERRPGALPQVLVWALLGSVCGLVLVLLEGSPPRPHAWNEPNPLVPVRLERHDGREEVALEVEGPYEVRVRRSEPRRGRDFRGTIRRQGEEVVLPDGEMRGHALEFLPLTDSPIRVEGRAYRGAIRVRAWSHGGIRVLNLLPLEDYLRGVVGAEIGPASPAAALDAQAIAARTYALNALPYGPLSDGTGSQVYGGIGREDPRVDGAVERTRGRVLLWRGKPLPAYYHSTCGGRTSDAREIFGIRAIRPLGGAECGFCGGSRFYRWEARLPKESVARLASEIGVGARLLSLRPVDLDPAGRWRAVEFEGDKARSRRSGRELRSRVNQIAGSERVRSTLLEEAKIEGEELRIVGRGWGHGVGMCQVGAIALARSGESADSILARYYPDATLAPLFLLP
ncbi:MAG: SpoIID/LytB domain-containing protein [Planctomycetes bacterium]|nr:SpoIID/LytB domain-containing protein [Planctomycetota bacterium]